MWMAGATAMAAATAKANATAERIVASTQQDRRELVNNANDKRSSAQNTITGL